MTVQARAVLRRTRASATPAETCRSPPGSQSTTGQVVCGVGPVQQRCSRGAAPEPAREPDRVCCCAGAVPSSDPREPVLFLRCGGLADAEALAANVDGSWSPKIAAVLRTSLGGAPPATGLSPLLLFAHAARAWLQKHGYSACASVGL